MTNQTPAYWVVIYTADDWNGPLISAPMWAKTPEEASHRVTNARQGRTAQNTVGPFSDQVEAESYRRMWSRDQGKSVIAGLLTETASMIYTNALHDRENRTPAQNAALPPTINLYQAFNIVCGGSGPDDTTGSRHGVNSADLVRALSEYLGDRSPLKWSQVQGRTHVAVINALHGCASALSGNVYRADLAAFVNDDPADTEVIETGPGFPVACASVHEHDPIACAPEYPADSTATESTVWAITAESFGDTDKPMPAETFVRISDMDAVIRAHRAAGASVEVSFPFGSDGAGTPTYVHVYADVLGVTTYRRANPSEVSQTTAETETTDTTAPAGVSAGDDTMVFLERQNRALEAFRSRIAQEITVTLQRIESRGPDASVSATEVGRWLSDMHTTAKREYDRQFRL